MPDLDQLLDNLVAEVASGTRAPGAVTAIKQARQRRVAVAVGAAAAVAAIAVGVGLAAGTLGGGDRLAPIDEPTPSPSGSPTVQETSEPPVLPDDLGKELDVILAKVPGSASSSGPYPADYDYAFNGPCSGNWMRGATGGADGALLGATRVDGIGHSGWPTAAQASDAAARFATSLASCTSTTWRTHPVARPGAVLASSPDAVVWVQQLRTDVWVIQVRTTAGPPPVGVQVEVAEWMMAYIASQNGWPEP